MSKKIRDEFREHHEGQAIFTARRMIFAAVLVTSAIAIAAWFILKGEPA